MNHDDHAAHTAHPAHAAHIAPFPRRAHEPGQTAHGPHPGGAARVANATHSARAPHSTVAAHTVHGAHGGTSLDRVALAATIHCLTGCAIGEVAGMVIGTALGWGNLETILLALALAFISGYALTMLPLLRNGYSPRTAARLALAADTASITVMEIVDNALMLAIPGAMDAPLDSGLFWGALAAALAIAGAAAFPVNRWLIARGRGHAVVHGHH